MLAGIGLVKPDGSSRKPDHDRVNVFLNRVTDDLYAEIARRFDPTIDDADLPGTADDAGVFQLIPTWREIAWRNAERLVAATTAEQRAAGRRQHRGLRRLAGSADPSSRGLSSASEQREP